MANYNPIRQDLFNLLRSKYKHVAIKKSQEFKETINLCLENILERKKENLTTKELIGYTLSE